MNLPELADLDPRLEISPYTLFRLLKCGEPLRLIDVRPPGGGDCERRTFAGAEAWGGPEGFPADGPPTVLFDDDGTRARGLARQLQARGAASVRALFGGLALYDFCLDPRVVGEERFLARPLENDLDGGG